MAEQEVEIGADVDVSKIMSEVRAEIERKRKAGFYPPEVLEEFDAAVSSTGKEDALSNALMGIRQTAGFTTAVTTDSELPVLAPVASSFKRVIRGSVRWYINGILQQIERFGASVIYALRLTTDRIRELEAKTEALDSLKASVEAIEAKGHQTAERTQLLREDFDGVRARERLPVLERAIRSLREEGVRVAQSSAAGEQAEPPRAERSLSADQNIDYLDFENAFLGPEEDRRQRMRDYIDKFRDLPGKVVDLGCGRGEFLEVLAEAGISGYGVERDPDMIERCREKGVEVVDTNALDHLSTVPEGSLGGIFSAHMIEHLEIPDVPRLFELAARALAPGGRLVIETPNPRSLYIFAWAFYIDLGHLRPLHPLLLEYLAKNAGFMDVRAEYFFPPPVDIRPRPLDATGDPAIDQVIEVVNENFKRLDDVVFGPQDYAIVARR